MVSGVQTEIAELEKKYEELTTYADLQGETLHKEITSIVNQRKSDIVEMQNKHMAVLTEHTDDIKQKMTCIKQEIQDLKEKVNSNDFSQISAYKARNDEFRRLPPRVKITFPSLSFPTINTEKIREFIGSLSSLSIIREEAGCIIDKPEAVYSPQFRSLLYEPQLTATINTPNKRGLLSVCCVNEKQIWTCRNSKIMKLLNRYGRTLLSINSKSGFAPNDIAVTKCGDLVYTDTVDKTVNLVKNKKIITVIKLEGWVPLNVYSNASDDLLVTMDSDDALQSKVVRYSGSTETQTIQKDDGGLPLYSSSHHTKYISENRNLDICVADYNASAVVVVNHEGKLRFKYTSYSINTEKRFSPVGITTDSHSNILIADYYNDRIHILDQDGQFLRYIQKCHFDAPHGLCVDVKDKLFVAEYHTGKVKKIQYLDA